MLCEQGRASTNDPLLRRLFPLRAAGLGRPRRRSVTPAKKPREAYRAAEGGQVPRGIFWLVFEYWRSDRDSSY